MGEEGCQAAEIRSWGCSLSTSELESMESGYSNFARTVVR
jgi:hypothetical protein